ncbi:MAG: hypothetical protein U1F71_18845 [Verrucomicrobiaceae bacterium]
MKKVLQTVQAVRSLLASGIPNPSSERTAADYARFCTDAEQRLEMVAAMLEKGSDYQALQIAEQEPALLDLAGALSFGQEKAWHEFCEEHQLTPAPRLNAKTVLALDALYTKGITANHPLYKDFRAAALSRDDDRSLQILHTILKLNPTDENARKELQRLDNKRLQETLEKLREALKTDDEEGIATLTESLAASAHDEKLRRFDAFVAGDSVRRALRKKQAEQRLPEWVKQMVQQQTSDDWQAVGHGLETLDAALEEHGIAVTDEGLKQSLENLRQFYSRESSADLQRRSFERALKNFTAQADEVEARLMAGNHPAYDEIASMDESFVRQWKELQAHQMPVPSDTARHLQAVGRALRSRLQGMRRMRQLKKLTAAAAVIGGVACLTAVVLHGWKAHVVSAELASYRTRQVCAPAEEMIRRLRQDDEWLLRWPFLQATVEEVDAWTRQVRVTQEQAREATRLLAASFAGETSNLPPGQMVRQLDDAEHLVQSLPPDLADVPRNELVAVRTHVETHLARLGKQLAMQAEESMADIEQACAAELSFEKSAAKTAESVDKLGRKLAPLEAELKPEAEVLRLPAALESRILAARQRLDLFQEELVKFAQVRSETAAASTLVGYKNALERWREIRFAEAAPAAKALSALPTEAGFLAALLTEGDEHVLKAVLDDVSGSRMHPDAPGEEELKILLSIRDDAYLNNIWENKVVDHSRGGAESIWWSIGAPTRAKIGDNTRWAGRYYDLSQSSAAVTFVKRDVMLIRVGSGFGGMGVVDSKPSPTSEFISALKLDRMTDAEGKRYTSSLLDVIESIMKAREASPIVKAYVLQRLEGMMRRREHAWGLHLCPSLQADLREFHQTLGNVSLQNNDWLVATTRDRLTAPLTAFFKKCEGRNYYREAAARRGLLRSAAQAGLRFGGYVEIDTSCVLNNPARVAGELWVLASNGGKPRLVANTLAGSETPQAARLTAKEALPLSPVFFLPLDRRQLLAQYQQDMAATKSDTVQPSSGGVLFISQP